MNLLIIFIILNVVNVIIQTVKSLATVKCGKTMAAIVNAVAYGLYTVVLVYTNADLPLWQKVAVVGVANLIGVYVVKLIEEKMKKEKLYKIEATFRKEFTEIIDKSEITHNYILVGNHTIFNFFCETKEEVKTVKEIIHEYNGKYFASETKIL